MFPLLHRIWWRLSGVLVYALVGPSGSGKSHRARLVASKFNIPLIVDGGLLIRNDRILAGKSAKKEENYLKAIKTAVFDDPAHLSEVLETLLSQKFKKILLIGTSLKMVRRLAYRLDLPKIYKVIKIEDIASAEEIEAAKNSRGLGRHVIPAPIREVSRHQGPHFLEPVRVLGRSRLIQFGRRLGYDKTIVLPGFHRAQQVLKPDEIKELIRGWMTDFNPGLALAKVEVKKFRQSLRISLYFVPSHSLEWIDKAEEIRIFLQQHLSRYVGWGGRTSEIRFFPQGQEEKE